MTALKILRYQLRDVLRSRWVIGYTLLLLAATELLFQFGGSGERVVLSLLNVVLILLPLVGLVFGTMYFYHSRHFIELLLTQPVSRSALFGGLFGGVALPLAGGFLIGTGIPFLLHGGAAGSAPTALGMLLVLGVLLTLVFTALAFFVALHVTDRATGLGTAILLWIGFTVVYDGALLLAVAIFSAWPLEGPVLVATLLNPVDLGRVLLLMQFDVAALMGYTGAVFARFFGSLTGAVIAIGALAAWAVIPFLLARRKFLRTDF